MHALFQEYVHRTPQLYQQLLAAPCVPFAGAGLPAKAAIYLFCEQDKVIRVGRTRNLQQRIRGHLSNSHYSASFLYKLTRDELGHKRSYTTKGSRSDLMASDTFKRAFAKNKERLRSMTIKFLIIENPVDQYLLELYATMSSGLPLDEFDTH